MGQFGLAYEIDDSPNRPYFEVRITNTLDYYTVEEAFLQYNAGSNISIPEYMALTDENKAKCYSAYVDIELRPDRFALDMTNKNYLKASVVDQQTLSDSYNYIKKMSFKIDALSSETVKFYKEDPGHDNTYPIVNSNPCSSVDFRYGGEDES